MTFQNDKVNFKSCNSDSVAYLIDLRALFSDFESKELKVDPGLNHLNQVKRALIVGYRLSGKTLRDTAFRFQVSIGTVSKLVKKSFRDTDSVANLPTYLFRQIRRDIPFVCKHFAIECMSSRTIPDNSERNQSFSHDIHLTHQ